MHSGLLFAVQKQHFSDGPPHGRTTRSVHGLLMANIRPEFMVVVAIHHSDKFSKNNNIHERHPRLRKNRPTLTSARRPSSPAFPPAPCSPGMASPPHQTRGFLYPPRGARWTSCWCAPVRCNIDVGFGIDFCHMWLELLTTLEVKRKGPKELIAPPCG